ncbi:unnamed protein product [Fraxinus pennsylvanica]|uniref:NAC domain-containing protein n=1 Tax=Fraxinus pennsylvanica TaxID=56036 RepID=A0AAD1Z9N5_9LAMI|nr:unnamed protein product [Fraxinus pennsylvanica]
MESDPRKTITAALTYPIDDSIPSTSYTGNEFFGSYLDYFSRPTDEEYFGSLPPGFRFVPRDDELIDDYLIKKIRNEKLPRNKINVLNLYEFNPEQLANAKWNNSTRKRPRTNKNEVQEPNNNNDEVAAVQEIKDHTLEVHPAPSYCLPNYQNPDNVVFPDVYDAPPYQNADIYSNPAPITMVSPIYSTHDPMSLEQYHELSEIPTIDGNEYLELESLLHVENKPYAYSLLFQPPNPYDSC